MKMEVTPMTLTIELPEEQGAALTARAQAQGVSAEEYARRVLQHDLKDARRCSDVFGKSLPKT